MNSIKNRVVYPKSPELQEELQKTKSLLASYERHERKNESLKISLGAQLIKLQTLFNEQANSKRAGFVKWAAKQFRRAPKTIEQYMRFARNPSAFEKEKRVYNRNPISRIQNAYTRLAEPEKRRFLIWLTGTFEEEKKTSGSETKEAMLQVQNYIVS